MDLASKAIEILLPFVAASAVAYLVQVIRDFWQSYKREKSESAYVLEGIAILAVRAAEQSGLAGLITNKKQYALRVAEDWLKMRGLKVDLHLIDAAIEAAVFSELNKAKPTE